MYRRRWCSSVATTLVLVCIKISKIGSIILYRTEIESRSQDLLLCLNNGLSLSRKSSIINRPVPDSIKSLFGMSLDNFQNEPNLLIAASFSVIDGTLNE